MTKAETASTKQSSDSLSGPFGSIDALNRSLFHRKNCAIDTLLTVTLWSLGDAIEPYCARNGEGVGEDCLEYIALSDKALRRGLHMIGLESILRCEEDYTSYMMELSFSLKDVETGEKPIEDIINQIRQDRIRALPHFSYLTLQGRYDFKSLLELYTVALLRVRTLYSELKSEPDLQNRPPLRIHSLFIEAVRPFVECQYPKNFQLNMLRERAAELFKKLSEVTEQGELKAGEWELPYAAAPAPIRKASVNLTDK